MKVLLVKCHSKTIFSILEPIVTEPLELEYLSGLLERMAIQHQIYDPLFERGSFEAVFLAYRPDVLVLTGYITAVDTMISYSKYVKARDDSVKVIVGGIHAELNYQDFFVESIDFIVHSNGIKTLEEIIKSRFDLEKVAALDGIAFFTGDKWQVNTKIKTDLDSLPLPNRSYFAKYQSRTRYLHYSPIAIVKTALSCPFICNFCYCRLLNLGTYATRTISSVVEEIEEIKAKYIWIVDDSFLLDRERILQFMDEVKRKKIDKQFVAYSRVDFIVNNEDIISKLADIGFVELIIGMEAVDDLKLKELNKQYSADDNRKAAAILAKNGIGLTALFIVGIDFTRQDFSSLRNWIRGMRLNYYAVSIFTPLKGTEGYQNYESRIQTRDYTKYDFLHLIIKPSQMNAAYFYFHFILLYLEQFLRSGYLRNIIYRSLKNKLKFGGNNG